jgi:hypothetical protein
MSNGALRMWPLRAAGSVCAASPALSGLRLTAKLDYCADDARNPSGFTLVISFYQSLAGPAPPVLPPAAPIRYRLMGSLPENWIPFIPVHVPDSNLEVQLQRARLPRIIPGGPPGAGTVEPRTVLLREGLDQGQPSFIHEEEVPRAGARVPQTINAPVGQAGASIPGCASRPGVAKA